MELEAAESAAKYDFASGFDDEPGIGVLALVDLKLEVSRLQGLLRAWALEPVQSLAEFDTVQSAESTLWTFEKETKRHRHGKGKEREQKLAKTLFADEPEMIVDADNANDWGWNR